MEPLPLDDQFHFDQLEIVESFVIESEDFKLDVVIPYFKDIYKVSKGENVICTNSFLFSDANFDQDLIQRSEDKRKGINRIIMMEYANLPGILFDRFFSLIDPTGSGFADIKSFLIALCKIYYSNINEKIRFAFDIYDFDRDGYIEKEDVRIVMSFMPIGQIVSLDILTIKESIIENKEGIFTQEGGGSTAFEDRVEA